MEIRTYKVFKFKELPKEAQEKALENYRYFNVEYPNWYDQDGLLDLTADEMKAIKVKMSKNRYESKKPKDGNGNIIGEYPAYTGLVKYKISAFDLDRSNYIQFENIQIMNKGIFCKFLQIPDSIADKIAFEFTNSREYNTEIDFVEYEDLTEKEREILEKSKAIWNGKVKEALRMLKKDYEYQTSDEAIIETLEANDYDFTIDGKID